MINSRCIACHANTVKTLLDFGLQPPSNRFLPLGETIHDFHELIFGQCYECGLLQLETPMPISMVRSQHEWLRYTEPEPHLDSLVGKLTGLVNKHSKIAGLTYKDESTLARFQQLGFADTRCYEMDLDFGINDQFSGLETLQQEINDEVIKSLVEKHGLVDVLIVRHVLEHAHDPVVFLAALSEVLAPGGVIVIEVPDCRKFVKSCDYSFIWEEHISYFSPHTLSTLVRNCGFSVIDEYVYSYSLEDSLIVVIQKPESQVEYLQGTVLENELMSGSEFANNFSVLFGNYNAYFEGLYKNNKSIAVFGAGHLAIKFINLFGLGCYISWIMDDNSHKNMCTMPGSSIRIVNSTQIEQVDLCMLSIKPESENKITDKYNNILKKEGVFSSVFRASSLALKF